MSTLNDCLNAMQVDVASLNLQTPGGIQIPVVIRKLPKKDETLDPPTQITICAKEVPETVKEITFANQVWLIYHLLITVVSPNNTDDSATNIPLYTTWRQSIRQKFQGLNFATPITAVKNLETEQDVFLDRKAISDLYDYQAVGVEIEAVETRSV